MAERAENLAKKVAGPQRFRSERSFQMAVERECRNYGWRYYHVRDSRSVSGKAGKGFPDLVIMRPPCLMFVELKLEFNYCSREQDQWLRGLKGCGQHAFVLTPKRFPQFIATLKHSVKAVARAI